MAKSHPHAGQINLRGKKYQLLRCKCCEVTDLRCKIEAARIKREIARSRQDIGE